jgi:hypothetical protein
LPQTDENRSEIFSGVKPNAGGFVSFTVQTIWNDTREIGAGFSRPKNEAAQAICAGRSSMGGSNPAEMAKNRKLSASNSAPLLLTNQGSDA